MLACDFFHVDCAVTLQRIYVLFLLEVGSRSVHLLGATTNPDGRWTTQQVRDLVMDLSDRVTEFRVLVRDRAGQFTASFDAVLADVGIRVVRIPPRCPRVIRPIEDWSGLRPRIIPVNRLIEADLSDLRRLAISRLTGTNCFAERFIRTVRPELTDRVLIFSQRHLRVVLTEYVRHYNGRRPHRARELRPPRPAHPVADLSYERIKCRPVLGGLINEYERAA
ncbi:MAG TPA: transposase [Pseudonocardiaceae bacterium]|nr:transposase [Pseudonocardiaceae bacterium]